MKTQFKKALALIAALCIIAGAVSGCSGKLPEQSGQTVEKNRYSKSYYDYFDTLSTVVGYEEEQAPFDENCALVAEKLEYYNKLYDIYHAYEGVNNLYTVNKNAGIAPVEVDEAIIDLLEYCKEMYTLTEGFTNAAMGSVLEIWHDYRDDGNYDPINAKVPPMEELKAAAEHCNIDDVVIDREKSTVYLSDPEMSLDVGAIGKGFATEAIADMLIEMGIQNYSLNIGGNIRTIGTKPDGNGWVAGIQNPDTSSEESFLLRVSLSDIALVTSGSYQRYYYVGDVKYHHIIDPETLMPEDYFTSVSILTEDSGLADALSTACFTMSYEKGLALVESLEGVEAMWVTPEGEQFFSSGFEKFITES